MSDKLYYDFEDKKDLKNQKKMDKMFLLDKNMNIFQRPSNVFKNPMISINRQKDFSSYPVRLPKTAMTGRKLLENALKRYNNIIYPKTFTSLMSPCSQKTSLFQDIYNFQTPLIRKKNCSLKLGESDKKSDFQDDSFEFYDERSFENYSTQNIGKTNNLFSPILSSMSPSISKNNDFLSSYSLNTHRKQLHDQTKYKYDFQKHRFMNDNESFDDLIKQLKEYYKDESLYSWKNLQKEKQKRDYEIQKLKDLSIKSLDKPPPLSKEILKKVEETLSSNSLKNPLIVKFNISITPHDIRTLRDKEWLNDEIINFYIALISERAKTTPKGPKVYAFNTFFYTTLEKKGYQGVRRWTKRAKVNILEQDYVLIPIHLGIHWCMSIINFKKKRFEYWDSLNGNSGRVFLLLRDYLFQESGNTINLDDWIDYIPESGPIQTNGYDCGVFACKTAECIAREGSIDYTQDDIKELRKRMVANIIEGRLF
ncbi:hypothetical protein T552_00532 [Pneumocystis carinii B80]|uniref:Ubiquitin-like protease family profile domain-containing protein n=1 Tax=Pneumocystis carinii (strain B80) TaxID=1408658 RepID=A0A0W4ZR17_PNEC8|nr:hypothetical protein T552_00532 [Pneumocystis carinii B80]KTW30821.1 hypothetical protein T552_00532 [Pneumocystis carinii B80]